MNDFYNTKFGPSYILENKTIVINNLQNFIKTFFKKKKFEKYLIVLDKKYKIKNECNFKEISYFLCASSDLKIFDYWRYSDVFFELNEITFKDVRDYRSYFFLSLKITRKDNKIFLESNERDLAMLFITFTKMIIILNEMNIQTSTYVNKEKIKDQLELFQKLCKYKKITIITDSDEDTLIRLTLYPIINDRQVTINYKS